MKKLIANVMASPIVKNFAATATKTIKKATKAVRAGVDSWNTIPDAPRELSVKDRLGIKLCDLMTEEAIRGTLTQRTARALSIADDYVSEIRVLRTWRYVVEADAVECLTAAQLRDIEHVISHCNSSAKNDEVRTELLALADQKDGMKLEESLAFGQPAAEEIAVKRFRAMQAKARN
jgi:hypothetical protein